MQLLTLAVALCLLAVASPIAGMQPLSYSTEQTLRTMFLNQLAGQHATIPGSTVCSSCLMPGASHKAHALKGYGTVDEMTRELQSRSYPQTVVDRLRALAFAANTKFHIYTINVNSRTKYGKYESYMAAGRRLGSKVEFGVIKGESWTTLITKTTAVTRKECKWILFVKKCKNVTHHVPRGNTAEELRRIEQALRHYAQISMKKLATSFYTF